VSGSVVVATLCASATNSAWTVTVAANLKGNVVNTASRLWCVIAHFELEPGKEFPLCVVTPSLLGHKLGVCVCVCERERESSFFCLHAPPIEPPPHFRHPLSSSPLRVTLPRPPIYPLTPPPCPSYFPSPPPLHQPAPVQVGALVLVLVLTPRWTLGRPLGSRLSAGAAPRSLACPPPSGKLCPCWISSTSATSLRSHPRWVGMEGVIDGVEMRVGVERVSGWRGWCGWASGAYVCLRAFHCKCVE
jgi:hypothetical protein